MNVLSKDKKKDMTTIHNFLGKCPNCSNSSITELYGSYSSFCMPDDYAFLQPMLVICRYCNSLVWQEDIEDLSFIGDESDDINNHQWWTEGSMQVYKDVLKDNQVNGKGLEDKQKQHLEQLIESREKLRKHHVLEDRATGCLYGLAHADISGGTSSMALLVFESLIENNNIGKDKIDYDDIGKRYLEWYNNNGTDTGFVNAKVFDLVNEGATFEEASKQADKELHNMTASSRPACRSLPITVYLAGLYNRDPDKWQFSGSDKIFANFIDKETKLTHRHLHASQISKAVNKICLCLMSDLTLDESIKEGGDYLTQKTRMNLGLTSKPKEVTRKDLKNTGYADDALIAAIWFIRNTNSFDEAVKESIKLKGKSNYCSVLVGAIGGALYGYSDIKDSLSKYNRFHSYHAAYLTPML